MAHGILMWQFESESKDEKARVNEYSNLTVVMWVYKCNILFDIHVSHMYSESFVKSRNY